jgi:hypothetical protein
VIYCLTGRKSANTRERSISPSEAAQVLLPVQLVDISLNAQVLVFVHPHQAQLSSFSHESGAPDNTGK